jgi:hypothetical protein
MRLRGTTQDVQRHAVDVGGRAHAVEPLLGRQEMRDAPRRKAENTRLLQFALLTGADAGVPRRTRVLRLLVLALKNAYNPPGTVIVDTAARPRRKYD